MRTIDIDCSLAYRVNQPTEFIMQIQAAMHPWQRIQHESLDVVGGIPEFFSDSEQQNRFLRFSSDTDHCELRYQATIEVHMPPRNMAARELDIAEIPSDILPYLLPSRYCESDLISKTAQQIFGQMPRGFARVEAICAWIKHHIAYKLGSSQPSTTAKDVLQNRAGVCRDFAHLGVAFCRALNIPARFVFGYAEFDEPPADFHALFEAYLEGGWMLFDPTKMAPLEKLVRIGMGTDAKDVAFATMYGSVQMLHLKPLVRDHVEGQPRDFMHADEFIGAKKLIRMR